MSVTRVKQIFIQLLSKKNTRTVNHPKQTDLTNWNNSKLLKFQKQKSKVSKVEFFKRFSQKNVIFDDIFKNGRFREKTFWKIHILKVSILVFETLVAQSYLS